jgi:hypothetical protein
MSAAEAMRSNRLHNQIIPNVSQVERSSTHQGITVDGFSEEVVEGLKAKGHAIEWVPCEWTLATGYSNTELRDVGIWAHAPSQSVDALCDEVPAWAGVGGGGRSEEERLGRECVPPLIRLFRVGNTYDPHSKE